MQYRGWRVRAWSVLVIASLFAAVVSGDDGGAVVPLDLPAGSGVAEKDEDESESILFYGQEYEGEGFFWCLDASGSMAFEGRIDVLKEEVTQAIESLSRRAQFSLVAFNQNSTVWSDLPREATADAKSAAVAWVEALVPVSWTCLAPAGVRALELSQQCRKRAKVVIVVGDGQPICAGTDTSAECLVAFQTANWERTPVHTLFVGSSAGAAFMQQLAAENGGSFTHVN